MRFQLVTYNIRKGKGIRGSRPSLDDLTREVAAVRPDLLLCQEVFHARDGAVDQTAAFASALLLAHRYEPNAFYRKGHHGNATFSRWPIDRHRNTDISTNRIERRGVLYTSVSVAEGRRLHVFNTHFGLSQRQRLLQARAVGRLLGELVDPADPVVLAGDFNDWSGRVDPVISRETALENAMLALAMKDRRTWSTRRPLFALDRVYYRNLDLVEVSVLREAPFDGLSDHFPVKAVFRFPRGHFKE